MAMALVEHSILLKCWAKIGISGAIGVSRMPLTQRQRVNIQRNLTVAGLPYWRLSMAALLRIADRVGLRAKRPQLADFGRFHRGIWGLGDHTSAANKLSSRILRLATGMINWPPMAD